MRVEEKSEGKYYATQLEVTLDDGRTVWIELSSSDPEPSIPEKLAAGDDEDAFCDGHYERDATRDVTDSIVGFLRDD